jgi:hypothetical protein
LGQFNEPTWRGGRLVFLPQLGESFDAVDSIAFPKSLFVSDGTSFFQEREEGGRGLAIDELRNEHGTLAVKGFAFFRLRLRTQVQ